MALVQIKYFSAWKEVWLSKISEIWKVPVDLSLIMPLKRFGTVSFDREEHMRDHRDLPYFKQNSKLNPIFFLSISIPLYQAFVGSKRNSNGTCLICRLSRDQFQRFISSKKFDTVQGNHLLLPGTKCYNKNGLPGHVM